MIGFLLMLFFTFCAGAAFGVRLCQGESDHRDGAGTLCIFFTLAGVIAGCFHYMN